MIGETISHYRIIERLGQGGMGEVYKAQDLRLQRLVALKLMLEEAKQNDNSKQRFVREARAASALNHPNIATVYEIDEVERNGSLYSFIVMEFVEGRTLKDFADQLTINEVLDIVMQIADGLAEAHGRGIVHRDIKPSNVMIKEGRKVKLLDFGVAKVPARAHRQCDHREPLSIRSSNDGAGYCDWNICIYVTGAGSR